jgi:hypothetical protein
MSTLGCDIRPLLRPLAHTILRCAEMEQHAPTGLEFCLACGQDFVSMVRCTRAGSDSWWLRLRCGACGGWHETFAPDDAVAALQRAITRGVDTVAENARCLDLERMTHQVQAFSQALELDLIGPDDF